MGVNSIKNYIYVSDKIASSGQPKAEQFTEIAEQGYKSVINLAMANSENALTQEGGIVSSLGMNYVHIPVPFDSPNATHLRQFVKIMLVLSEFKVWVHCALNHRASAFLYQYHRIVYQLSPEEAGKVLLPSWQPNQIWKDFMLLSGQNFSL